MLPLVGTILFDAEPERECWHEAGHGVTGFHLGIPVIAIGFTWNKGENAEPNPSTWSDMATAHKENVAVYLFGGMAAEILKLKDYDQQARGSDVQKFNKLGCKHLYEHYLQQAMDILEGRDAALVRVFHVLMERRLNPPSPRSKETDNFWKQEHIGKEEFEALM